MKGEQEKVKVALPDNAFRELKDGEVYNPLMSKDKQYSEVNLWSVMWGVIAGLCSSYIVLYKNDIGKEKINSYE